MSRPRTFASIKIRPVPTTDAKPDAPQVQGLKFPVAMVDALPPGLPVAIEERSAVLRANFPDLNARAREVARTSRAWLDAYEAKARP